jgi:glycosyltransferase involved in cell wall biosynthesis
MKVLITSPSLDEHDNVSGISTMISSIIENGNDEFVHFTAGRKDGERFDLKWFLTQLKLPFAFRATLAASKPDVVHINTSFEPRSIIRDAVLSMLSPKERLIVHVHGGRFVMEEFQGPFVAKAANKLLRSATRIIVLSELERKKILERSPGLRVDVLPNAVATRNYPEVERNRGPKNVAYLGRMQESKGLSEMVEACRILVGQGFKFRFSSYGTGPDEGEFIRRMTDVLGENYSHGGVVSGEAKMEALRSADVFLMPSRFEGLSLAVLEAMAAGCVPIVSNRGSMPSLVDDGRNGFLVDPGDLTQIVGKMKFLLSEGEPGWASLRHSARQTIIDKHDIGEYMRKLDAIYVDVTTGAKGQAKR